MMEVDKDHIHLLIDYVPQISISQIVRKLKQETTVALWNKYDFTKYLWKEKTFWSDEFFVCSTGDASTETIRTYIENQG
jgi:putative transposase